MRSRWNSSASRSATVSAGSASAASIAVSAALNLSLSTIDTTESSRWFPAGVSGSAATDPNASTAATNAAQAISPRPARGLMCFAAVTSRTQSTRCFPYG